jgi:hypothetical protein
MRSDHRVDTTASGETGHFLDSDLAVLRRLEQPLHSCFVVATSKSSAPSSDPQSAEGVAQT